jgi:hypothetical protein
MARKFLKCALSKTKKFATTGNFKCSTRPWHNHTKGQKRWGKKASSKKKAKPIKAKGGKGKRVRAAVNFVANPNAAVAPRPKRKPRVDYAKLAGGK